MDNSKFEVKEVGESVGKGLFAKVPLAEGDFLVEYTGIKLPNTIADEMEDARYLFELDDTWTIDGEVETNDARYINHSCDPNAESDVHDGHILITAIRDIPEGEEITMDYGLEYYDEFIRPVGCKCGAKKHH